METKIDLGMLLLLLLLSVLGVTMGTKCEELQDDEFFSYGETTSEAPGPSDWYKKWEQCDGRRQSPINIVTTRVRRRHFRTLKIEFDRLGGLVTGELKNNGNAPTFFVDEDKGTAKLKGNHLKGTYKLDQFHVHFGCKNNRGSEHTRNGHRFAAEIHFVFVNSKGRIAVVAVWLRASKYENTILGRLANQMHKIIDVDESTKIRKSVGIRLMRLIPRKTRKHKTLVLSNYYHYMGSLTTPPCCENVSWFVLKHRVPITDYQLSQFRELKGRFPKDPPDMCDNFRPIQPRNGRKVYAVIN